jgi:flagellar hook-basal body complex protein FliE
MDDLQIKTVSSPVREKTEPERSAVADPLSDFKKVLSRSMTEVNNLLSEADQSAQEMVAGRMDIHQAMVAIEKANLSVRLMIQVRNKMMSAYEEIMRMQM